MAVQQHRVQAHREARTFLSIVAIVGLFDPKTKATQRCFVVDIHGSDFKSVNQSLADFALGNQSHHAVVHKMIQCYGRAMSDNCREKIMPDRLAEERALHCDYLQDPDADPSLEELRAGAYLYDATVLLYSYAERLVGHK